jgi:CheY-like chemotaxis protein
LSADLDTERIVHRMRSTIARLKLEVELLGQGPEADETRRRLRSDIAAMEGILERVAAGRPSPPRRSRTVVIVDDDERFAELVRRRLAGLGFVDVRTATAAAAVRDLWKADAVLVADLSLILDAEPGLRSWLLGLRPVVLTGASQAVAEEAVGGYSSAVVSKLASFDELLRAIDSVSG